MAQAEWTLASGLRAAAIHTLIRSLVGLGLWTAAVYFAAPLLDRFDMRLFLLPSAAFGALIGWMLVRNLSEAAGFAGWILIGMASIAAVAVIIGGMSIVSAMYPLSDVAMFKAGGPACVTAVVIIVMLSLQEM